MATLIRPRYLPDSIVAQLVSVAAFLHSLDPFRKWSERLCRQIIVRSDRPEGSNRLSNYPGQDDDAPDNQCNADNVTDPVARWDGLLQQDEDGKPSDPIEVHDTAEK